jgi:hypothetical protein
VKVLAATIAAACLLAMAGCGGDSEPPATPEDVAAKLQEAGFATGEVITDGANMAVADGGELDADAYLSVDSDPEGNRIYAGIYFFASPEDAAVLAEEREPNVDNDFAFELIDDRVYEIAGDAGDLQRVIAAVQAE